MKQDKEAITEILSAIAQAQLALSAAERAFQDMVKSMPHAGSGRFLRICRLRA